MIVSLLSDFGIGSPYQAQMAARCIEAAPGARILDLVADLVPFRPDLAAYMVPALVRDLPPGGVCVCVVDPGVGGARDALAVAADGRWFVGPDNGLLALVAQRAVDLSCASITWRPERLSATFHGRDLFAPVAAAIARGEPPPLEARDPRDLVGWEWPLDRPWVCYRDAFGNLMTGLRASAFGRDLVIRAGGHCLEYARTFTEVPEGRAFWYENALGLVELAVNRGRADRALGLTPGDPVEVVAAR